MDEYIEELYKIESQKKKKLGEESPIITKNEVTEAIQRIKKKKAQSPDREHVEMLKLLEENGIISIAKKPSISCEDHRTINLLSHVLRVFLHIIHEWIYFITEGQLDDYQCGLRNSLETRETHVLI